MSTAETETGRGEARRGGGYDRPSRRSRFEIWSWVFMRISGLFLIFMALYHLVWWNLVVGVEHLDSQVVIDRWRNPWFRLFNAGLVTFALLHGLNGARYNIEDYVHNPKTRKVVKWVVYTVVLLTLAIGIFALLAFDPDRFFANR